MRRRRKPVAAAVAAAAGLSMVLGVFPAAAVVPQAREHAKVTVASDWRVRMLASVNALRAVAGVPPVTWCPALGKSADRYAKTMAKENWFGHVGPNGSSVDTRVEKAGYRWRAVGENLAGGQLTVSEAMRAWRASAPHMATLVNPAYRHVGFGFAQDRHSTYRTYWVQDFGQGKRC